MSEITIDDIVEFNRKYSLISTIIEFIKDTDVDFISIKDIKSVDLITGLGDSYPYYEALHNEDWGGVFNGNWEGDGHYCLEIAYKIISDNDGYRQWYYYEIQDIKYFKYKEEELKFDNDIPFDWDNF